ncbi:MAG: hypothetical protein K0R67_1937 [Paenibacillus sp.]|nr:hypothetical protein [Paenibacillus sp.]
MLLVSSGLIWLLTLQGSHTAEAQGVQQPGSVRFQLVVRSSPNASWKSSLEVNEAKWSKAWEKRSEPESDLPQQSIHDQALAFADVELQVAGEGDATAKSFSLVPPNLLVEVDTGRLWNVNASSFKLLRKKAEQLREQHYGALLNWKDAQTKMPRKSSVQVTDLETGLSFRVQRRAGSQHADVQPITKADTAIMKQIYGGNWSWKRRAIIVGTDDGERLAASMHGMPHGGDGIPGNGFSGHFCIHFLDSTTHKTDETDLAHQLMAHKAAGKLFSYRASATPLALAASFLEGVNQHDPSIIRMASQGMADDKREQFMKQLGPLVLLKLDLKQQKPEPDSDGKLEVDIEITALVARSGKKTSRETFEFQLSRLSIESPWRMTDIRMR